MRKNMLNFFVSAVSNSNFQKRNTYYLQRGLCKARSLFSFMKGKMPAAWFLTQHPGEPQLSFFVPNESCNHCELISLGKRTRSFYFIPALDA